MNTRPPVDLARSIDHSLLRPELTPREVEEGLHLALEYSVAAATVRPCDVATAQRALAGSDVAVNTVIGFPHGSPATEVKVYEAERAMDEGATELDVVINIGWLKGGEDRLVEAELSRVIETAHDGAGLIKVILETGYLTDEMIVRACRICERAGADFVKSSTGYGPSGATIEHIRLMRASVGPGVKVKAAGGIRTLDQVLKLMDAGASRIATRATKEILDEARTRQAG
jgi:deoxyribose-phosphate aldolase